jgi:hypothetical protein
VAAADKDKDEKKQPLGFDPVTARAKTGSSWWTQETKTHWCALYNAVAPVLARCHVPGQPCAIIADYGVPLGVLQMSVLTTVPAHTKKFVALLQPAVGFDGDLKESVSVRIFSERGAQDLVVYLAPEADENSDPTTTGRIEQVKLYQWFPPADLVRDDSDLLNVSSITNGNTNVHLWRGIPSDTGDGELGISREVCDVVYTSRARGSLFGGGSDALFTSGSFDIGFGHHTIDRQCWADVVCNSGTYVVVLAGNSPRLVCYPTDTELPDVTDRSNQPPFVLDILFASDDRAIGMCARGNRVVIAYGTPRTPDTMFRIITIPRNPAHGGRHPDHIIRAPNHASNRIVADLDCDGRRMYYAPVDRPTVYVMDLGLDGGKLIGSFVLQSDSHANIRIQSVHYIYNEYYEWAPLNMDELWVFALADRVGCSASRMVTNVLLFRLAV